MYVFIIIPSIRLVKRNLYIYNHIYVYVFDNTVKLIIID